LPRCVGFGTISCVPPTTAAVASSPKLLDRVRWHLRVKHYSIRTEQAYVDWIRRYILFHRKRHPNEMSEKEITEFLTHLPVEKSVAASTQNQAFSALLFLYQQVLDRKLDFIDNVERVKRPAKLPVVFTTTEARAVLAHLKADYRLMADLLYGSGLRLMECLRLRIKDISPASAFRQCERLLPVQPPFSMTYSQATPAPNQSVELTATRCTLTFSHD